MNIVSCLAPQRIVNPYTKKVQVVPCGKCTACLGARSMRWVSRLEQESYCWKYTLFFTLTYANEYLPLLHFDQNRNFLVSRDVSHLPKGDIRIIDVNEHLSSCEDKEREYVWLCKRDAIPYLSVYDIQCFLKRLRKNCKRYVVNHNQQLIYSKDDAQIRYFICGEYGPTTYRPHYHGLLFFNSPFQASYIQEMLHKSWPFGYIDASFVETSASSYVASYVNSFSSLPEIYRRKGLRPFSVCSRCPPLGTLIHDSETLREIVVTASPEFVLLNRKKSTFDNVPLWRYYQNRLFPKLSRFDDLSHTSRIKLYRYAENFSTFDEFYKHFAQEINVPYYAKKYFRTLMDGRDTSVDSRSFASPLSASFGPIYRWYTISHLVIQQAKIFHLSVDDYVTNIERYYYNVEQLKLKHQYDYEEKLITSIGSVSPLAGLDADFLKSLFDASFEDLDLTEIEYLRSYGIDLDKFFSDDLSVRYSYQSSLLPENTWDYHVLKVNSDEYINKKSRTKRKNDYLLANGLEDLTY